MNKTLLFLLSGDIILSIIALNAGYVLRFDTLALSANILYLGGIKIYAFVLVLLISSHLCELYDFEKNAGKKEILVRTGINIVLSFLLLSAIYYLIPVLLIGRGWLIISLACFGILQFFCHIGYLWCSNIPGLAKRVLVIGTGPLANKIGGLILSTNHNHLLSGYFHCSGETVSVPAHYILNNGKGLIETIREEKAKKIVISLSERRGVFPCKRSSCLQTQRD